MLIGSISIPDDYQESLDIKPLLNLWLLKLTTMNITNNQQRSILFGNEN